MPSPEQLTGSEPLDEGNLSQQPQQGPSAPPPGESRERSFPDKPEQQPGFLPAPPEANEALNSDDLRFLARARRILNRLRKTLTELGFDPDKEEK